MSLAHRQQTCPACGKAFVEGERVNVEIILEAEQPMHYIAVHWSESTYVVHEETSHVKP